MEERRKESGLNIIDIPIKVKKGPQFCGQPFSGTFKGGQIF